MLRSTIAWRDRQGDHDLRVERVEERNGRFAVVISWAESDGTRHQWAHLLRLHHGMISEMEDYSSGEHALRALRRRGGRVRGRAPG